MGVREEQKNRTRELIMSKTTSVLQKRGFVKVSSKEIANVSNVSQGTIFLHFKTKDNLLNAILSSNIEALELELKTKCRAKDNQDVFLKNYLDALISHEEMLSRAYKDYSYLSENLKKQLDGLSTFVKNLIFDNFRKNQPSKKISIVDSFIAIDAFTSQIKDYLLEKEISVSSNSIIRQRRGRITKLYRMLFDS